jgi:hypothetical protein
MDKEQRELRQLFMPIAVVEHHQMLGPRLDVYDICDRLGEIWKEMQKEAETKSFTLDADCILGINERIAKSFNADPGSFLNKEDWLNFTDACGSIEEETSHTLSWLFSALYWHHLTHFKLATVWLFINALRLQYGFPEYRLSLDKLGTFLDSLSGSGPPLYDGQTFYPEDYS